MFIQYEIEYVYVLEKRYLTLNYALNYCGIDLIIVLKKTIKMICTSGRHS